MDLPGRVFQLSLRAGGLDAWAAAGMRHQFADVVRHGRHGADVLTMTVADLTGEPPTDLGTFLRSHREKFAAKR